MEKTGDRECRKSKTEVEIRQRHKRMLTASRDGRQGRQGKQDEGADAEITRRHVHFGGHVPF